MSEPVYNDVMEVPPDLLEKRAKLFFERLGSQFGLEFLNYQDEYAPRHGAGWYKEMWEDLNDRFVETVCTGEFCE